MARNDGGPAFPRPIGHNGADEYEDRETNSDAEGMSLRDYFAGQAMNGMLSAQWTADSSDSVTVTARLETAQWAYKWADAMLAARLHLR